MLLFQDFRYYFITMSHRLLKGKYKITQFWKHNFFPLRERKGYWGAFRGSEHEPRLDYLRVHWRLILKVTLIVMLMLHNSTFRAKVTHFKLNFAKNVQ